MGPPTYKLEILWSQTGGSATVYSFYRGHSEFIRIFLTCEDTRNLGHKALYCSNRYSRFFILHLMNKFLHLRVKKKHEYHLFNKVKGQSIRWAKVSHLARICPSFCSINSVTIKAWHNSHPSWIETYRTY